GRATNVDVRAKGKAWIVRRCHLPGPVDVKHYAAATLADRYMMPIRISHSSNRANKTLSVLRQSQSPIIQKTNLITSKAIPENRAAAINVHGGLGRVRTLYPRLDGKGLQL